MPQKNVFSSD